MTTEGLDGLPAKTAVLAHDALGDGLMVRPVIGVTVLLIEINQLGHGARMARRAGRVKAGGLLRAEAATQEAGED